MRNIPLCTRKFSALAATLVGSMLAATANAVPVGIGETVSLPGTSLAAEPNLAGTVLLDNLYSFNQTFGADTYVGTVQERVVRESGSGTLDFYWRVSNTGIAGIDASLGDFRLGNFNIPGAPVNLDYRTDGLGTVAPGSAVRFSGGLEDDFNFMFPGGIAPGQSSYFLLAETDATDFTQNAAFDLTNVGESQILYSGLQVSPVSQQVSPVPEPTTCAMMLAGIGLMGFAARRRKTS